MVTEAWSFLPYFLTELLWFWPALGTSKTIVAEGKSLRVMVNFMCQFGWTMVPRYLVTHYSSCFYEVSLVEIHI